MLHVLMCLLNTFPVKDYQYVSYKATKHVGERNIILSMHINVVYILNACAVITVFIHCNITVCFINGYRMTTYTVSYMLCIRR